MSCQVATYDLCARSNADFGVRFLLKRAGDQTPIDLTNVDVLMQIRPFANAQKVLLDVSAGGYLKKGAQTGEITIEIPRGVIDFSGGVYDILLDGVDDYIAVAGKFEVKQGVTR